MLPTSPEHRSRDLLLIILGATTGATDATAFERLGHVFASVITGNLVLLGVSAAQSDGRLALFSGCALAGYALGVLLAAPASAPRERSGEERIWPPSVTVTLSFDLALLVLFTVGWELDGNRPGRVMQVLLLALVAAAMGVQSTAVRRLGEMSTTYLTSTLTGLIEALRRRRWTEQHARSVGILVTALAGAAGTTALILHAQRWVPVLQLAPLVVVIVASRRLIQRESVSRPGGQEG